MTYNGTTYSVTAIGDSAFHSSTGLTSVTIPETVTELGRYAFFGCTGMTRVNITDLEAWCNIKVKDNPYGNPVYFAKHLFLNGTEVTDLVVPDGVTQLGPFLFYNCEGLTSVIVSNSVTSIRWSCFNSCPNLTTITLGSGLTSIENHVFELLPALTSVTCLATTPPVIDVSTFDSDAYSNAILIVPKGCKSAYQADSNWSRFVNIVELSRDFEENGICYNIMGENTVEVTYRTTNYNSYSGYVSIPATVIHDGVTYDVTAIGDHAFYQCTELKEVWMGNSQVVTIGDYAMSGCPALEYSGSYHTGEALSLPKNLVSIGNYAFHDSNIKYIWCGNIIPPPVIQLHTFDDEQYANTHIQVASELEISIYQAADYWRNFVHIDDDDMAMYDFKQDGIYYAITGDNTVSVATENFFGGSYKGDVVVPQTVTYIGNGKTYNVTGVAREAFAYCEVADEDSPDNLFSVTLPSSIDSIGEAVFHEAENMKVLTCFATTPPAVENSAFFVEREYDSATGTYGEAIYLYDIVTLYVPASAIDAYKAADGWKEFLNIEPIPYDFFVDGIYYRITSTNTVEVSYRDYRHACYSGDVVIPETVTHDGSTYPVTAIGNEAFMSSEGLTSVTIPNSVTGISYGAFLGCTGLTSVALPSSLAGLGDCSFMNCTGLTSVTIPGNVYYVGSYAFYNCTGLTSVTIGSGVTSIGLYTFCDCHALTDITCLATTPPTIQSNTFTDEHYTGATLTVPASSLNTYTAANYWKNFLHIQAGGARGDVNGDNNVNITDVTALINYLLSHNAAGVNVQAADCNQDSNVNITDVTTLINYLLSHHW